MLFYTTPIPRAIFSLIPDLKDGELRVLLFIAHKTLGWKDKTGSTKTGKKEIDWIAASQFIEGTGLSRRALGIAIGSLQANGHITVTDGSGIILATPAERKGKYRLYFRLGSALMPSTVDYAEFVRTGIAALGRKLRAA